MGKPPPLDPRPTAMQPEQRDAWTWSFNRLVRIAILAAALCVGFIGLYQTLHPPFNPLWFSSGVLTMATYDRRSPRPSDDVPATTPQPNRVPLEAHIMSICPDAKYCFQDLIVPAMEKVHDKVDFKLSFIGKYVWFPIPKAGELLSLAQTSYLSFFFSVSDSTSDVACKHGPKECVGNMLMLCAANLPFPCDQKTKSDCKTPTIRSLGFANCLLRDYKNIPDRDLVEGCALEHGIDFKELNKCASSQSDQKDGELSGLALLRESCRRSQQVGAVKSCTVRVDEKKWCVLDGGDWKECQKEGAETVGGLVKEIERLYKEKN
ncbi:hypothetical protein LOZ12_005007 [Ophidiomyces ophidiicola]|uniref:Uncharacterized protein n=1 Tax=Ophidiomyces ophidiicola TaxID=1387563 RepID=A0ACB8URT4_9EURO|nr:uncharacterized protein LOZ57_002016 [Ophidiomyces ophidiicola]KAI1914521.1 hypothetical protein LOZ61_002189 [Ophidiomyces ophidiicola]KAI1918910.1 hypothetical protein LOZ64_002487 [Ophidiomyces ophidiicola]KAI1923228.1 hypothetical protein LOZ60_005305 [Ophidiomyces ophidiicola]KAI1938791.1 hypothetical protein LOZ62_005183 [Ophidiomyces ophidiicola]KAI1950457.1 hypothetical protein LOZ57_002016 [Ophidiomyces ophidiicola]